MATNLKQIFIPPITKTDLDLADACARELWRGYRYHNGSKTTSDDWLLHNFSMPTKKYLDGKTKGININSKKIKHLIKATQVRKGSRKDDLNITNGMRYLPHQMQLFKGIYLSQNRSDQDFFSIPSILVYEVGKSFYKGKVKNPINGCQAAFASRLLFFALPELPIFNYSRNLAASIGIKNLQAPHVIPDFYEIVAEGYCRDWTMLNQYEMPFSNYIDDDFWLMIKKLGWWQRRIYDIALLLHYKKFSASQFIHSSLQVNTAKYL
jgi:hypothetical protein